jgi:DNA replication protein DnaC
MSEPTIEVLEAQRRLRAKQVGDMGIPQIVKSESLEAATERLRRALVSRPLLPDKRFDELARVKEVERLRSAWNAPARHVQRTEFDPEAKEWLSALEKLKARLGKGFIVGLVGIRGPGKTQMGVELMRESTKALRSAYYCTAMDYFMHIKDAFQNDSEKSQQEAQKFFVKPKLLVLDEVHVRSGSSWEDNMLTDLIGKRYNAVLDTVLISNQTLPEFQSSVGASIMDRLNETGGVVEAKWKSFRA